MFVVLTLSVTVCGICISFWEDSVSCYSHLNVDLWKADSNAKLKALERYKETLTIKSKSAYLFSLRVERSQLSENKQQTVLLMV